MYPTVDERVYIDAAEKVMIETMARYDPSHDAYHVQRVRKTALALADALPVKPDLLVIELAALLHDVLDKKYVTPEEAADPYSFFLPLFSKAAETSSIDLIKDGRAQTVSQIIVNVSWTTEKSLRASGKWGLWQENCTELHCVQDADRLDAIGAFGEQDPGHLDSGVKSESSLQGILRCAAFTASKNKLSRFSSFGSVFWSSHRSSAYLFSPLYTSADDPSWDKSAIQHFHDKLVHIKDRLKTEPGKMLGEKRHKLVPVLVPEMAFPLLANRKNSVLIPLLPDTRLRLGH
ncbi:hypothetical protein AAF712_005049 [Marasmius tenuissimus]|uniref:HD/PDEase domain-containing protein n=1 Tax=Marasmius tenuissimus TaxID=585030 RepID=A0ABR3A1L2_9AGAR